MKKPILFQIILFILMGISVHGQGEFKTLFVNDNEIYPSNTDTVIRAFNASGIEYDFFDARDSLRSPSAFELSAYDLVIWYCGTDGYANYFWNGDGSDNPDLTAYLETGGMLWVMGNDFLYDRYTAPSTFSEGDFVFDYMGTWEYHAQSYGDDGGLGVEQLDLLMTGLSSVQTLHWIFPTAWWIDACVPIGDAISVYEMGPAGYSLAGYSSAIFYASNNHTALSFFFDPSLIDSYTNRVQLFTDVLSYLRLFSGNEELQKQQQCFNLFPNPVSTITHLQVPEEFSNRELSLFIMDASGRILLTTPKIASDETKALNLESLPSGYYLMKIQGEGIDQAIPILKK